MSELVYESGALAHYAKGTSAKKHKYLYIDANGNYVYKDRDTKENLQRKAETAGEAAKQAKVIRDNYKTAAASSRESAYKHITESERLKKIAARGGVDLKITNEKAQKEDGHYFTGDRRQPYVGETVGISGVYTRKPVTKKSAEKIADKAFDERGRYQDDKYTKDSNATAALKADKEAKRQEQIKSSAEEKSKNLSKIENAKNTVLNATGNKAADVLNSAKNGKDSAVAGSQKALTEAQDKGSKWLGEFLEGFEVDVTYVDDNHAKIGLSYNKKKRNNK